MPHFQTETDSKLQWLPPFSVRVYLERSTPLGLVPSLQLLNVVQLKIRNTNLIFISTLHISY